MCYNVPNLIMIYEKNNRKISSKKILLHESIEPKIDGELFKASIDFILRYDAVSFRWRVCFFLQIIN